MGCCGSSLNLQLDIPFKKVENYNKLIIKLEEFLSNKGTIERKDNNKILDLLIKTSNKISEYKGELNKLKKCKKNNVNVRNELIEGIIQDIKKLKDYHIILNRLLKENEQIVDDGKAMKFFNENKNILLKEINPVNKSNDLYNNESNSLNLSEKNFKKENLYYKKYIRRNKKGILNQKKNIGRNLRLNYLKDYENPNKNYKNDELTDTSEKKLLNIKKNNLNLIFQLESGKKSYYVLN